MEFRKKKWREAAKGIQCCVVCLTNSFHMVTWLVLSHVYTQVSRRSLLLNVTFVSHIPIPFHANYIITVITITIIIYYICAAIVCSCFILFHFSRRPCSNPSIALFHILLQILRLPLLLDCCPCPLYVSCIQRREACLTLTWCVGISNAQRCVYRNLSESAFIFTAQCTRRLTWSFHSFRSRANE